MAVAEWGNKNESSGKIESRIEFNYAVDCVFVLYNLVLVSLVDV